MKRILNFCICLFFFVFASVGIDSYGQESGRKQLFEGKIVFQSTNLDTAHEIGLMRQYVEYLKGNQLLMDIIVADGQIDITYVDGDNSTATHLRIIDTIKVAIKYTKEDLRPDFVAQCELVPSNETKVICGFPCKKVTVNLPDKTGSVEVWYTTEMTTRSVNFWMNFSIDGVILSQTRSYPDGIKYKMEAVQVVKEPIPAEKVNVPRDYKLVSYKELNEQYFKK